MAKALARFSYVKLKCVIKKRIHLRIGADRQEQMVEASSKVKTVNTAVVCATETALIH